MICELISMREVKQPSLATVVAVPLLIVVFLNFFSAEKRKTAVQLVVSFSIWQQVYERRLVDSVELAKDVDTFTHFDS